MSGEQILSMQHSDAASLGRLRRRAGVEVGVCEDTVWVRVANPSDELDRELRTLPGMRFNVLPDQQLVQFGGLTPTGYLPNISWTDLATWMQVAISPPAFGGAAPDRLAVQMVRGGVASEANVLLTSVGAWRDYALTAPQVRLDVLSFAISDDGQTVIRGTPSPPIAGVRYVEQRGIAAEAGWTWRPHVDADVLAAVIQLEGDDLALLHADGSWDLIHETDFARASRSAARQSTEAATDT